MKKRGWECKGLEADERAECYARDKLGLDVSSKEITESHYADGEFELITLWHVLEHLSAPVEMLREIRRVLTPGGVLVVAVPNSASLQARLAGQKWLHLDVPYHLYHFSLDNLSGLLSKYGFVVLKVRHFSLEQNAFGFLEALMGRVGFRRNALFDTLRPGGGGHHDGSGDENKGDRITNVLATALMFLTLPVLAPLALILSIIEAALGMGGTVEVYAQRSR